MPSVEESIRTALGASAALAALVGNRIYPNRVPNDDTPTPWLYYSTPDSTPIDDLDAGPDLWADLELDILAEDYDTARAIADAAYNALHTYRGGQVKRALWAGGSSNVIDLGYHLTERYRVHGTRSGVLLVEGSSQGQIEAGVGSVKIRPSGGPVVAEFTSSGLTVTGVLDVNGSQTIDGVAGTTPLVITGGAGHTGELLTLRQSGGQFVFRVHFNGNCEAFNPSDQSAMLVNSGNGNALIQCRSSDGRYLSIKQNASAYGAIFTEGANAENLKLDKDGSNNPRIGFLGANPLARPTVTGGRGGNAALASLLTALANLGLVTDSTT